MEKKKKQHRTSDNFRIYIQENRTDDLLQSDDEAEDVDAEEIDVGIVESRIEQNVDDPNYNKK